MKLSDGLTRLHQQQYYLQTMGIQCWLPRQRLAHAAKSADWVAELVWPIADTPVERNVPNACEPSHPRLSAAPTVSRVMPQVDLEPAPAAEVSRVEASEVVDETPLPERFKQPRYALAFISAGDLLLVDSLPPHAKQGAGPAYYKLLQGICRALAVEFTLERFKVIAWPVFSGPHANQSGEEAQNAVRRQLELSLAQQPVKRILLLGEPAAQWLLEQDQSLEAMRGLTFSLRSGVKTQVSYSLTHMLKLPEFKADCWCDLQPLL